MAVCAQGRGEKVGADYEANDADDDYYEGKVADDDYYEANDADDDYDEGNVADDDYYDVNDADDDYGPSPGRCTVMMMVRSQRRGESKLGLDIVLQVAVSPICQNYLVTDFQSCCR